VLREIAGHVVAGVFCFVLLWVLAVAADYGGIRGLISGDPSLAFVQSLGAMTTFAPLIICIAIGSLRRGEQRQLSQASDEDDRPLR
jgi:hypothetical protein